MPHLVLRQKINQNKYSCSVIGNIDKTIRWWVWVAIFCILFVDQALKIWVKTNLLIGDEVVITDWFILHFVENNGFAFRQNIILWKGLQSAAGRTSNKLKMFPTTTEYIGYYHVENKNYIRELLHRIK